MKRSNFAVMIGVVVLVGWALHRFVEVAPTTNHLDPQPVTLTL